jgi:hypothetical protein
MRLRGLSGARDEFHLAAIVQNLKTLALRSIGPPVTRYTFTIEHAFLQHRYVARPEHRFDILGGADHRFDRTDLTKSAAEAWRPGLVPGWIYPRGFQHEQDSR